MRNPLEFATFALYNGALVCIINYGETECEIRYINQWGADAYKTVRTNQLKEWK